jgi:hypothetical protein
MYVIYIIDQIYQFLNKSKKNRLLHIVVIEGSNYYNIRKTNLNLVL